MLVQCSLWSISLWNWSWHSSVGIVTKLWTLPSRYRGYVLGSGMIFVACPKLPDFFLGHIQPPIQCVKGAFFLRVNWPESDPNDIWCRGQECVELHLHSLTARRDSFVFLNLYVIFPATCRFSLYVSIFCPVFWSDTVVIEISVPTSAAIEGTSIQGQAVQDLQLGLIDPEGEVMTILR